MGNGRFGAGISGGIGFGTGGIAGFNNGFHGGTDAWVRGQNQISAYEEDNLSRSSSPPSRPGMPGSKISGGIGGNGGNGALGGRGGTGQGVRIREESRFREITGGTGGNGGTGSANGGDGGTGEGVWIGDSDRSPSVSEYGTPASDYSPPSTIGSPRSGASARLPAMSLEAFCARYSLSERIEHLLQEQGYETAGGLFGVSEQDLSEAGLKKGQIGEVKRAVRAWLAENDISPH
ncbi:hypothetical protein MIND_00874800 [Mycena indigotica]|uniref:SAM domain-containing protein n=1 Tax=Mycena indigotica TaxID=2126181 RepID=A0A8H6SIG6_9AGAR|nr:uncharacterized protein MIND_00874800 [Mycena indigotica]KAF7299261.1 hypothetical protein MIND_00874800 [Mycena indigotica]